MEIDAAAAVFSPVRAPTTFEETVERLGSAIRTGVLAAGVQLPPERELAEQLRISRSTLRQALTALAESGHLVAQRGRGGGTFVVDRPPIAGPGAPDVAGPLPDDWREACAVRRAFEVGVACLAAERAAAQPEAVAEGLLALGALVDEMDADAPFPAYRRADAALHVGLAELTGVRELVLRATELQARATELIAHIAHPRAVLGASNAEHRRLLVAVGRGDATAAVRTVRRHLAGTEHVLAGLAPGT
ncbi:GntR family transcriptional regulator [Patulibacter sp. SYSU D01012]|uniref:FadR/GntR family transcriptional regulator n=1 Tax=Patulibacter sp. SYSU D01012 TaxID=2817381 RepID=UPI001B310182|nr:GntR family transcriptional regulator [Patulibacter sp. SYSU D01012]